MRDMLADMVLDDLIHQPVDRTSCRRNLLQMQAHERPVDRRSCRKTAMDRQSNCFVCCDAGTRSHHDYGDALVPSGHAGHRAAMMARLTLRLAMRAAIILGLIVSGWTPAAMAMPRVSDCAMMMQTSPATDDGGDMDTRAPCPFAAYCAVASVFVAPDAAPAAFVVYRSAQVPVGIDDVTPAEFQPSPPARPPRS